MRRNEETGNYEFYSKKPINLYCFTDVHFGHKEHDSVKFNKVLEELKKDPEGYCFFNGDSLDLTPPFWHDATDEQDMTIEEQILCYKKVIKSLGKKVLFHRVGNHEIRVNKVLGNGLTELLLDMNNIPMLHEGYDEFEIVINKRRYRLVSSHGEGGGAKPILTKLTMAIPGADMYYIGHNHEFSCDTTYAPYTHMGKKIQKLVYKVVGGTFQKPADYARTRNMLPNQTGCYVFRFDEEGITIKELMA